MLFKDQKTIILLQNRDEERHPTGKFFWFCLKSLRWDIRAQWIAQPALPSKVPPNYTRLSQSRKLKLMIRLEIWQNTLWEYRTLFSSFY